MDEYLKAMKYNQKRVYSKQVIARNNMDLNQLLPVMRGRVMNFTEANGRSINPHYYDAGAEENGYWHNCQTCTVGYELRRRGFPVEALPNKNWEILDFFKNKGITQDDRFLDLNGKRPIRKRPSTLSDTITAKVDFIESATKDAGRYELYLPWKVRNGDTPSAHVMIVERQKGGGLLWYDPQTGKHGSSSVFDGFMKKVIPVGIRILRIDDKIINPKLAKRFKVASKQL